MIECIGKAMESGGVGTPINFDLTWERLLMTLTINALPTYQDEILGKFSTMELTKMQLTTFLNTKPNGFHCKNKKILGLALKSATFSLF